MFEALGNIARLAVKMVICVVVLPAIAPILPAVTLS